MKGINRRKAINLILSGTSALMIGIVDAKKKKKGGKKGGGKKGGNQARKLQGTIVQSKENITTTYKLAGSTIYSFARSVEDKVKEYEGQEVTVYGRVERDRIVTVELVTSK